jgi:hypothetical protein
MVELGYLNFSLFFIKSKMQGDPSPLHPPIASFNENKK